MLIFIFIRHIIRIKLTKNMIRKTSYSLTTSSDKVSIRVYDPSVLQYKDCAYTVSPDGSTYTFTGR